VLADWSNYLNEELPRFLLPCHVGLSSITIQTRTPLVASTSHSKVQKQPVFEDVALNQSCQYTYHAYILEGYYLPIAASPEPFHLNQASSTYTLSAAYIHATSLHSSSVNHVLDLHLYSTFHSNPSIYSEPLPAYMESLVSSLGDLAYLAQAKDVLAQNRVLLPWHIERLQSLLGCFT